MDLKKIKTKNSCSYPTLKEIKSDKLLKTIFLGATITMLSGFGCSPSREVRLGGDIAPVRRDSDGDGVWDNSDKCPKKKGTKNNNGCPAPMNTP